MSKDIILKVENVEKSFPVNNSDSFFNKEKFMAVNKVSFEVEKGEIVGLIGESGCGKTTVGKIVTGLVNADKGNIYFEDKCLNKLSKAELRDFKGRIQMIFQDPNSALNPQMKIGKILKEALHSTNVNNKEKQSEIMHRLMEKVGISEEYLDRFPHELSGGQKQRICIMLALLTNPSFVVADEVVSALDLSVQAQILNVLKRLQQEFKLTILFISHNLDIIYYMSNKIIVMYMGEVVEFGQCEEVYKNCKHPYTKLLLSSVLSLNSSEDNEDDSDEEEQKTNLQNLKNENACSFASRCPYKQDKCLKEKPCDKNIGEGQIVKCHFPL